MSGSLTIRQRLKSVLTNQPQTARDLAHRLGIPERQVEDHLIHVKRSLEGRTSQQLTIVPAECTQCQFIFTNRTRFTCPSRCPKCKSEDITPPKFIIVDSK